MENTSKIIVINYIDIPRNYVSEIWVDRVKPLILSFSYKKLPQLRISSWRKKLMYRKKA